MADPDDAKMTSRWPANVRDRVALKSESFRCSFRQLMNEKPTLLRRGGKQKRKPDPESESQTKDLLNDNILTSDRSPNLNTKMIKPLKHLMKIKSGHASSLSLGTNSLLDTTTVTQDIAMETGGFLSACGAIPPSPRNDRIKELEMQLGHMKSQVIDLNEELKHVYEEKEDAMLKLNRMIRGSNARRIDHKAELEEVRLILTELTMDSALTEDDSPCFLCGCS